MATQVELAALNADIGGGVFAWITPGAFPVSASTAFPAVGSSNSLTCTDFGFTIPGGSTIDGIEVLYTLTSSGASATRRLVETQLWNGANIGTAKSPASSWADQTLGGAADVWGATLSPAIVNSMAFGVRLIGSINPPISNPPDAVITVTSITMTVYYTAGSATTGASVLTGPLAQTRVLQGMVLR
jgi:hypothetical protein